MKARIIGKMNDINNKNTRNENMVNKVTIEEVIRLMKNDKKDEFTTFFTSKPNENGEGLMMRVFQACIKEEKFTYRNIFACNIVFDNDNQFAWNMVINLINKSKRVVCDNMTSVLSFKETGILKSSGAVYGEILLIDAVIDMFDEIRPISEDERETSAFKRKYVATFEMLSNNDDSIEAFAVNKGYHDTETDKMVLNSVYRINVEDFRPIDGTLMIEILRRSEEIYCIDEDSEKALEHFKTRFSNVMQFGKIIRTNVVHLASKCKAN